MKIAANREIWRNFGVFAPFCKKGPSRMHRALRAALLQERAGLCAGTLARAARAALVHLPIAVFVGTNTGN